MFFAAAVIVSSRIRCSNESVKILIIIITIIIIFFFQVVLFFRHTRSTYIPDL